MLHSQLRHPPDQLQSTLDRPAVPALLRLLRPRSTDVGPSFIAYSLMAYARAVCKLLSRSARNTVTAFCPSSPDWSARRICFPSAGCHPAEEAPTFLPMDPVHRIAQRPRDMEPVERDLLACVGSPPRRGVDVRLPSATCTTQPRSGSVATVA